MRKQLRLPIKTGSIEKEKKSEFRNRYDFIYAGRDTINQAFFLI